MKTLNTNLCNRTFKLLLCFIQIFTFTLVKNYAQSGPPPGTGNWVQTFNENFTAINMASDRKSFTTADGNTWITTFFWGNGAIGDGSLNYYTGNNVSCDGNNLVMKVSKELAAGSHPFAGGLANTDPGAGGSFSQKYGYYEIRVKISMTNGDASYAGVPPVNHAWPPETEMFESPYAWGKNGQRIHFLEKTKSNDGALTYDFGTGFHLQDTFHTIGYLWEPAYVVFYVDGIERGRSSWTSHSEPSFLNIGHGCGSDGGNWNGDAYAGIWPQNTYFDYFKVWTKDGSGTKVFVAPAAPTAISGDNKIAVSWLESVNATSYIVKRSTSAGSGYVNVDTVTSPYYVDTNVTNGTKYYYVISAVNTSETTANSKETSATPKVGTNGTKISGFGTVCGEPFSSDAAGYRAYDGDISSYFDYITPDGAQTGIDMGANNQISLAKIRFYPRGGFEDRMNGGQFQGSTDNVTFTTLYTIEQATPAWNEVSLSTANFRYFRYIAPVGSYGNVNEIEYYETSTPSDGSVTGVQVAPVSANINVDSTKQLTAIVSPPDATNKSVTWTSSNSTVATVNSSGLVTGVAAGVANITVNTADGGFTSTSAITVTPIPEAGWNKVDDVSASIVYTSNWDVYTGNGGYLNTEHYVEVEGQTASFTFTGTKVRFYGFNRSDLGNAQILIDNEVVATVDCYAATQTVNVKLYESAVLSNAQHTIKIKCLGTKNTSSVGFEVIVDAFEYYTGTSTVASTLYSTGLIVNVFPNPITAQSVLKINSHENSDVNIQLTDISGRIVFANKISISGEYSLPLNLDGLGKGTYFLQVQQGNQSVTKRILK